jgi:prophage antirepressor-like protein
MNNVINFFSYQQKQVRVIIKDGEPWWVAKDVCDILEINNSRQAITRLDEDEKNTVIINDGTSGNPNKTIINEPGLYTLILTSRKPEAKEFKRWITHEVIPSIRKTGKYNINNNKITPLDAFKQLIKVLDEQNERIEQLENKQEKQTK